VPRVGSPDARAKRREDVVDPRIARDVSANRLEELLRLVRRITDQSAAGLMVIAYRVKRAPYADMSRIVSNQIIRTSQGSEESTEIHLTGFVSTRSTERNVRWRRLGRS